MLSLSRSSDSKILDSILKEARVQKKAVEFANQEAMNEYMKAHPDADPKNHSVKQEQKSEKIDESKKDELTKKIEEKKKELKPTEIKIKSINEALGNKEIIKEVLPENLKNVRSLKVSPMKTTWTVDEIDRGKRYPTYMTLKSDGTLKERTDDPNVEPQEYSKKIKTKEDLKKALYDFRSSEWDDDPLLN